MAGVLAEGREVASVGVDANAHDVYGCGPGVTEIGVLRDPAALCLVLQRDFTLGHLAAGRLGGSARVWPCGC